MTKNKGQVELFFVVKLGIRKKVQLLRSRKIHNVFKLNVKFLFSIRVIEEFVWKTVVEI